MNNDDFIDCVARTFLLYLLGYMLLVDKTGGFVQVCCFTLLMNLCSNKYAWETGARAYLYRQLGASSRYDSRRVVGYI